MSNQISASATIENLAIILAEQVKAGMPIEVARHITRETCRITFKRHDNAIATFESAWARFQGRVRK